MCIGIKAFILLGFFYPSCHGGEAGILPVLVPPRSKKTYLKGGLFWERVQIFFVLEG
jgi:hypothetical protein